MEAFYIWLELSPFSVWMRESTSVFAFPAILTLHTVGLAFLAGPSAALDLRLLGVAPGVPLASTRRLFPVMWAGFWLNAVTGTALVVAYPAKALTNPLFYVKLALVALGLIVLRLLQRRLFTGSSAPSTVAARTRALAVTSLVLWLATIFAGRWLAYTYTRLLAYSGL